MNLIRKIIAVIQKGSIAGAPWRLARAALGRLFAWRVFILAARDLDESVASPQPPPGFEVHPIETDRLMQIQRDMAFTEARMEVLKSRLEHNVAGIMATNAAGEVVYTSWWARGPQPYLGEINQAVLAEGEIMILDSICRPDARGHGLHSALFQLCLRRAYEQGFKRAYVLHLAHNVTARRIHEGKSLMKPLRKIHVYKYFGKPVSKVIEIPPGTMIP